MPATPPDACSTVVAAGTDTASLTGLDPGTSYTWKAYSDVACATEITSDATDADLLTKPARVTGLTLTPGPASLAVGWTALTGTVTGYKVQWRSGGERYDTTRQSTVTGASVTGLTGAATITGLTVGVTHTVRVMAYNATGDGAASAEASGAPAPAPALAAGGITETGATLTLSNHTGDWYFKYTSPDGGQCSSVQKGATADVTVLRKGTTYTFSAYTDAGCSTVLATAPAFETLVTAPATVIAFTGAAADQSWSVDTAVSLVLPAIRSEGVCAGGSHATYTLTPALPAGLSLTASTRTISGTPTTAAVTTEYTWSATDASCSQTATQKFDVTVAAAPAIRLSRSGVTVTEGGAAATYTVRLKSAPANQVSIIIRNGDENAATTTQSWVGTLGFHPTNYDSAQTVTVRGVEDADGIDETVTITHSALGGGGNVDGKTASLTVTVTDDDKGLVFDPASLTLVEGASATWTVALAAAPSGDVTVVHYVPSFRDDLFLDPASLTFTTSNWSRPQTLTATSRQDADAADDTGTVWLTATGGGYGVVRKSIRVTVRDDEVVSLSPGFVTHDSATLTLAGTPATGGGSTPRRAPGSASPPRCPARRRR